jgi:pimeloyl-ACP methyl ester carboxylesterase
MPYLSVDGTRLYYDEQGAGPPLLLIHGLGSSSRDWFKQVDHFADRYRVLRVDLRGHGRSERPPGPYHIAQFARDVAVCLRRLDAAPAHVVGLSMGGMVALQLAADAPPLVRSLVVANSVADTRLQTWGDLWFYVSRRLSVQLLGMRRVGRLLAGRLFPKPDQDSLRREFIKRWAQNDKQAYVGSVDAIMGWSVRDRLPSIAVPTLLVSSDQDYTPVAAKNRIAARMPNAELAVVEDARHALPVEKPDAFNALVADFLRRVDRPDAAQADASEVVRPVAEEVSAGGPAATQEAE